MASVVDVSDSDDDDDNDDSLDLEAESCDDDCDQRRNMKPRYLKDAKAAQRRAHFANNGTMKSWKMETQVLRTYSEKAERSKRACREPIDDSEYDDSDDW